MLITLKIVQKIETLRIVVVDVTTDPGIAAEMACAAAQGKLSYSQVNCFKGLRFIYTCT